MHIQINWMEPKRPRGTISSRSIQLLRFKCIFFIYLFTTNNEMKPLHLFLLWKWGTLNLLQRWFTPQNDFLTWPQGSWVLYSSHTKRLQCLSLFDYKPKLLLMQWWKMEIPCDLKIQKKISFSLFVFCLTLQADTRQPWLKSKCAIKSNHMILCFFLYNFICIHMQHVIVQISQKTNHTSPLCAC